MSVWFQLDSQVLDLSLEQLSPSLFPLLPISLLPFCLFAFLPLFHSSPFPLFPFSILPYEGDKILCIYILWRGDKETVESKRTLVVQF